MAPVNTHRARRVYRKSILINRGRRSGTSRERERESARGDEEFPQEMKQKDEKTAVVVSPQVRKVAARAVNGNNYAAGALTLPFPAISCCERNNAFAKRSVNHTREPGQQHRL